MHAYKVTYIGHQTWPLLAPGTQKYLRDVIYLSICIFLISKRRAVTCYVILSDGCYLREKSL